MTITCSFFLNISVKSLFFIYVTCNSWLVQIKHHRSRWFDNLLFNTEKCCLKPWTNFRKIIYPQFVYRWKWWARSKLDWLLIKLDICIERLELHLKQKNHWNFIIAFRSVWFILIIFANLNKRGFIIKSWFMWIMNVFRFLAKRLDI